MMRYFCTTFTSTRFLAAIAMALLLCAAPLAQADEDEQATSEDQSLAEVAKGFYAGFHSLNGDLVASNSCMGEQGREELSKYFDERQAELQSGGMRINEFEFDFTHLAANIIEEDGDLARVEVSGPYAISGPYGREWNESPEFFIMERIEGRWTVCGERQWATMPLKKYRAFRDTGELPEIEVQGPPPLEVARNFFEAVTRINAKQLRQSVCFKMQDGLTEFAAMTVAGFEAKGAKWSETEHDFSDVEYSLVSKLGGLAEVNVSGVYRRSHPEAGEAEQPVEQLVTLIVEEGHWRVCDE